MNPLVDVAELRELIEHEPRLVLADVRYQLGRPGWGREQYDQGHLVGAHFVDLDAELSAPLAEHDPAALAAGRARPGTHPGGRHPLPSAEQLTGLCQRLGIDDDSVVVALDQSSGLAAARLWWLLTDAGHQHVRVLDGGMAAWQAAGREVSTDEPEPGHGSFVPQPGHRERLTSDGLPEALAAGVRVVDVRAAERHAGRVEPVDPVAGHIPGASNLPMSELLDDDGHFLPVDELRRRLSGLRPGDAFSCGSGLTASHALLAAEAAGLAGLKIHPGSWSDWISDPRRGVDCEAVHD